MWDGLQETFQYRTCYMYQESCNYIIYFSRYYAKIKQKCYYDHRVIEKEREKLIVPTKAND